MSAREVVATVALGSNLGPREAQLEAALRGLAALPGTRLLARSRWHETAPVGGPPGQGPYLNGVVQLVTELGPRALLAALLELERRAGRERVPGQRDAARTLDLDLVFYGQERRSEPGLELPHPRAEERLFVLVPLAEIAPELVLPRSGKRVRERVAELQSASASAGEAAR